MKSHQPSRALQSAHTFEAQSMPGRGWGWRDAGIALGLSVVLVLLFSTMSQARLFGDGASMVHTVTGSPNAGKYHVGYLLGRELLDWCWPSGHVLDQARLFSAICCGLGCGFTFLFARGLGLGRSSALLAVALAASTPAAIFFGTTVEIHAWQFCLASLGACVAVAAPWGKPLMAVPIAAFGLFLAFVGHETSIFLGPGWVLLCAWLAARQGAGFSKLRGFLLVGPAILALLILYLVLLYAALGGGTGQAASSSWELMVAWGGMYTWKIFFVHGLLLPLLLVIPLLLLGLRNQRFESLLRLALGTLVAVPLLFLIWYRVPERGGFLMGVLPFAAPVAVIGLRSLASKRRLTTLTAIVAVNGAVGLWAKADFDSSFDPGQHVQLVREVTGGSGVVLTAAGFVPPLSIDFPELEQLHLGQQITMAILDGVAAPEFAVQGLALVELLVAQDPTILERGLYLDCVSEANEDAGAMARGRGHLQAFEAALATKFNFEHRDLGEWRISRLTAK